MSISLILLLPFVGSLAAAFLPANARNAAPWLAGAVALACSVLVAMHYPELAGGAVVRESVPWVPLFGLELVLRLDGYAWLFAMLVSGMGLLVVLYARYYMSAQDPVPRFFSFLLAFMGAMLGVVMSGNLIQMVVFWELTSLTSFMLIAYWYHREDARRGARMALIVTVGGGLCLMLGVLMLGWIVGSFDLDVVLAGGAAIRAHPWYEPALVLILLGVFTKSAQFPFHFWLPHAMAAPTPVSAYLHSATMVKAGVFLLARLWPVLSGTDLWFWLVSGTGAATLLVGAFSATFQRDLKGVLAYSTISHLGLITLLLGMNSRLALIAAVFHMINHATFKASLFMAAGIIDHETGTRDIGRLGGLWSRMPITTIVATVAAAAMAGVPLLNGFLSKEMFFAEALKTEDTLRLSFTLPLIATVAAVFSVAYSLRFIHQVFFGKTPPDLSRLPHEPTRGMLLPSAMLVLACVLVGILPAQTVGPLLATAAQALLGVDDVPYYKLAVWHGLTLPLVMSLIALAGGVVFYLFLLRTRRTMMRTPVLSMVNAARIYDILSVGAIRGAGGLTRLLFSWRLQPQLLMMVCTALVVGGLPLLLVGWTRGPEPLTPLDPLFLLLWLIGGACAMGAAFQAKFHRLAALILVGGVGLVTCLTFAWFSAPDLALTQIAVEVVTVVLILLGLRWLPRRLEMPDLRRETRRAKLRRARDATVAVVAGAGFAAVAYAVLTRPSTAELAPFYIRNALEVSAGRNVVNVILVDFRGFDTFGEITVVGIVAIIVYALLRRFRPAPESIEVPRAQRREGEVPVPPSQPSDLLPPGDLYIPAVLTRVLVPMAGMVSLYFLLRGHNAPGGGFVGGLVMATAVIVHYMTGGTIWVEARLRVHPLYWIGCGLLAAAGAGLIGMLFHQPFLTAQAVHLHVPLLGELHLSTVLLFDLGVYMLVVGAALLILVALAHQSLRSARRALSPLDTDADEEAGASRVRD